MSNLVLLGSKDRLRPKPPGAPAFLTLAKAHQILTASTEIPTDISFAETPETNIYLQTHIYPQTLTEILQIPLKEVNLLGSSTPGPMQQLPQETSLTGLVTRLLFARRLLGVPVALVTDPSSLARVPEFSVKPLPPPPQTP